MLRNEEFLSILTLNHTQKESSTIAYFISFSSCEITSKVPNTNCPCFIFTIFSVKSIANSLKKICMYVLMRICLLNLQFFREINFYQLFMIFRSSTCANQLVISTLSNAQPELVLTNVTWFVTGQRKSNVKKLQNFSPIIEIFT